MPLNQKKKYSSYPRVTTTPARTDGVVLVHDLVLGDINLSLAELSALLGVGGTNTLSIGEASNATEEAALFTNHTIVVRMDLLGSAPAPTVPAAPTISTSAGAGQNTISWVAVSGAISYNLYYTSDGGTPTLASTKVTGVTSPKVHSGLTNGTTYKYVLTAVNAVGESALSAVQSATPSAITRTITLTQPAHGTIAVQGGATTVADGGSVTIVYTPSADYHITAGTASNGAVSALSGNSYTISNITANTTIGATVAINTYTITTTAGANGSITDPDPTVNYGGGSTITITPAGGYHVADVLVDGVSVGAVTSYNFTGVAANHTISATFALTAGNAAPSAPTSLSAGIYLANGTGFTLSWDASSDSDGSVASYKIYKGGVLVTTSTTASRAITGQTAGSSGSWTVSAVDNLGLEGTPSSALTVQLIPSQPVASVTAGDTQNTVSLASGGSGSTSYDIWWGTAVGVRTNHLVGVTLPYTHTGITNGIPYYYSITALNASGSSESAEVSGVASLIWTFDGAAGAFADSYFTQITAGSGTLALDGSGNLVINAPTATDAAMLYRTAAVTQAVHTFKAKIKVNTGDIAAGKNTYAISLLNKATKDSANSESYSFIMLTNVSGTLCPMLQRYSDSAGALQYWNGSVFDNAGAVGSALTWGTEYTYVYETTATQIRMTVKNANETSTVWQSAWFNWTDFGSLSNPWWLAVGGVLTRYGKMSLDSFQEI